MLKKIFLAASTFALLISMGMMSNQGRTAFAQDGGPSATSEDDTEVTMVVTGVIQAITQQSQSVWIILLDDDTKILVNPATFGPDDLKVGATITVTVSVDDDSDGDTLVAKVITAATATPGATASPTSSATPVASASPTASGTQTACGSGNTHPVAARLADAFGVSYDEIMGWHCQGFGFGEIAKAYLLAKKTGKSASDYFGMKKGGQGWGNIIKDAMKDGKFSHKDLAMGQVGKATKEAKGNGGANNTQGGKDKGNKGGGNKGGNGGGNGGDNGGNKGGKGKG